MVQGWAGFFLLLIAQTGWAQNHLSLTDALRYGAQYNVELQVSIGREAIAVSNQKIGSPDRRPVVDVVAGQYNYANKYDTPTSFVRGVYQDNSVNGGLNASWLLYNGGRVAIGQRLLDQQLQQAKLRTLATRQSVNRTIIGAYYRAVVESEKQRVRAEAVTLSKARWLDMKQQDRLGKASLFDVLQAENLFLTDSTTLLQQEIAQQTAYNDLHKTIGWSRFDALVLTDSLKPNPQPPAFANLPGKLLSLNYTLRGQRVGSQILTADRQLRQTALQPVIRLNASINHSFTSTKFPDFPRIDGNLTTGLPLGLSFVWPVVPSLDVKRAILQSGLERTVVDLETRGAERRLLAEADLLGQSYQMQAKVVALSARLTTNASRSLVIARDRLMNGFSNLIEYRTMQLAYTEARLNQLQALYALKIIEADANALIGALN
ncbi:TolC family protein [Spirosoma pomorum]